MVGDRDPDGALKLCSRKTPRRRVTTVLWTDDETARDVVASTSGSAAGVTA
jgi:hypothetical protein